MKEIIIFLNITKFLLSKNLEGLKNNELNKQISVSFLLDLSEDKTNDLNE